MKLWFLDIETLPIEAEVWGLRDQFIGLNQIITEPRMMCFGASRGGGKVDFYSEWTHSRWGMISAMHGILDDADAVVHYNGNRFDMPWANTEMKRADLLPPSPYWNIDLYRVVKSNFYLPSYKLDYVAKNFLGLEGKEHTGGHELWTACRNGDPKAQRKMRKYCIQDVKLLPEVYEELLPWIKHPNRGLYSGDSLGCPNCGSEDTRKEGFAYLSAGKYQRHCCNSCGKWFRDVKRVGTTDTRGL